MLFPFHKGAKKYRDGSHFRIDPDDLDFPARNISQVKVFVEIDGSRISGEILLSCKLVVEKTNCWEYLLILSFSRSDSK